MEASLDELKRKFCEGEKAVVWKILENVFPELWLKIFNEDLEVNGLLAKLADYISANSEYFCQSELPIKEYFEEKLIEVKKENEEGKKGKPLDEETMNIDGLTKLKKPITQPSTSKKMPAEIFLSNLFRKSLSAIDQIIYEMYYRKKWKKRKGVRQLFLFLVNTFSLGSPPLQTDLKKIHSPILTPEITNWYVSKLEEDFLSKDHQAQPWKDFVKSTEQMLNPQVETDVKRMVQNVQRNFNRFGKRNLDFGRAACSEVETFYSLIHEYHGTESRIEIWFLLNILSGNFPPLLQDLKKWNLRNDKMKSDNHSMKEASILKNYVSTSTKKINEIRKKLEKMEQDINGKLDQKVKWNTY